MPQAAAAVGMGSPRPQASTAVALAPSAALTSTTCAGSRSARARDKVLSAPQAIVASKTASRPASSTPPRRPWSTTSATPPASSNSIAAHTRRSMVSWYSRQASSAVKSASSVSINDALLPLVRCSPQASATGPTTAPKPAMASRRDVSARRKRASCCTGLRNTAPMPAAPAYSNAAVLKAPRPAPRCCTSGVLTPNSTAASSARAPPRKAGPWR